MNGYAFIVHGTPVAKERARTVRTCNGARSYTPAKTVAWETAVAWEAKKAGVKPLDGPVAASFTFSCRFQRHGQKNAPRPRYLGGMT
jgi:Holliday junction resolvase RusA-like endonuclease